MRLAGKRIIVTGGARGIGEAVVRAAVAEGARVQVLDGRDNLGGQVAAQATEHGPGAARYLRCDVSDRAEVKRVFADCADHMGGIDALVHVAGIHREAAPEAITDEEWDDVIRVNLNGTFITNQEAFPHLRRNADSRIINFGSMAGLVPYVLAGHYAASKGAVISWSRTIAHAWGREGIRVNVIAPAVESPMQREVLQRERERAPSTERKSFSSMVPLGVVGQAEDVAPGVIFLLSDEARYVTGQILSLDGGLCPSR